MFEKKSTVVKALGDFKTCTGRQGLEQQNTSLNSYFIHTYPNIVVILRPKIKRKGSVTVRIKRNNIQKFVFISLFSSTKTPIQA